MPIHATDAESQKSSGRESGISALSRLGPQEYVRHIMRGGERSLSERRIVTTLFADIVDSTSLAEKLDPEDVTSIMNSAFQVLTEPIIRYEGTLARLMGDGVLCLFGAPLAHEDDTWRACMAALEIIERVGHLSKELQNKYSLPSFEARVGISTGLAVVGEVGTEYRTEYTAMGDSVNLASRLQREAKPDSILICKQSWRQTKADFETKDMGMLYIKGKTEPIHVYQLLGRARKPIEERTFTPLVGRDSELHQLQELVYGLSQNRGALLTLSGEAGIGKSRLLRETRRTASDKIIWAEAQCHSYTSDVSHQVARNLLQNLIGVDPLTPPATSAHRLRQSLDRVSVSTQHSTSVLDTNLRSAQKLPLYASLGYLLHIPLTPDEQTFIDTRKGEILRQDILSAYQQYIHLTTASNPLVLVWENINWVDSSSLQILESLVPLCCDAPLLLVLTVRPESGYLQELTTKWKQSLPQRFQELQLLPLSAETSAQLLRQLFDDSTISESLTEPLLSKASGNPFFLEEMFRTLSDIRLNQPGKRDELLTHLLTNFSIPDSVQAALLSRIDRLSFQAKKVLQVASVVGQTFLGEVLWETIEPEMKADEFKDALEVLEDRNFIQRFSLQVGPSQLQLSKPASLGGTGQTKEGSQIIRADGGYPCIRDQQFVFTHVLTAEVVYQSLLKSDRKQLHQRAGETIEHFFADRINEFVPTLSYHFDQGGDVPRAVSYLYKSGKQSAEVFALDQALASYLRALKLAESDTGKTLDQKLIGQIYEGVGDVFYFSSEYESALERYEKAQNEEDNPRHRASLFRKRGWVLEKWGRYEEARSFFENGLDVMKSDFDEREAGRIYAGLCLVYHHLDEPDIAIELGNLALLMNQRTQDQFGVAEACNNLGVVLTKKKDWDSAQLHYEQSRRIYEQLNNPYGLASCYNNMAVLATNQCEWGHALRCLHSSLRLFKKLNNQHGIARVYDNIAQVFHLKGNRRRADNYMAKAVTILAEISAQGTGLHSELWQSGIW